MSAPAKQPKTLTDKKLTKSIGESWVASMLARHGWATALTRDGLARTDILAVKTDDKDRRMIEIQVKTASVNDDSQPGKVSWPLGVNSQIPSHNQHEWFVLVAVPKSLTLSPRAFIIPRNVVSGAARIVHEAWLLGPSKQKRGRNASAKAARVSQDIWAGYEDKWELLDGDTDKAPILLPKSVWDDAQKHGVSAPAGHPWRDNLPKW